MIVSVKNIAKHVGQQENIATPCQFLAVLFQVFSLSHTCNSDILKLQK
jgi:hypothetical protein